jgi:hypothetical protein
MTDDHWRGIQLVGDGMDIVHVVGDRTRFEWLG